MRKAASIDTECTRCAEGYVSPPATNVLRTPDHEKERQFCAECFQDLKCGADACRDKGTPLFCAKDATICYVCGTPVHDNCCTRRTDDDQPLCCGWCEGEYSEQIRVDAEDAMRGSR